MIREHEIANIKQSQLFAHLKLGKLDLLIPQSDVFSLEPTLDMSPLPEFAPIVGQMWQAQTLWSLYAFSENLTLLDECPVHYRVVILLKNTDYSYGIICEQVQSIEREQVQIQSLPSAMETTHSPLLALALYEEKVRCISSAQALRILLPDENH